MARSKHNKRKKRLERQNSFYEAMPSASIQPAMPEMRAQLAIGAGEVWYTGREISHDLWGIARAMGRRFLRSAGIQGRLLREGMESKWPYARAGLADAGGFLLTCGRVVVSRRVRLVVLALGATAVLGGIVVGTNMAADTFNRYSTIISSPAAVLNNKKSGTTILDRNGVVLYNGYGAQSSATVPFDQLPQTLKDATLAAEDPTFYDHPGFSWQGTARALFVDITHGRKAEGGSTLTQQLVKNAILTSNKTFERKFQELVLSMQLEGRYSKDQILGMYLNEVYYGQGSNGVEAAAQSYFRKPAKDLALGESAFIAGLPLGPSRFDPNLDPEAAVGRRNFVLDRMTSLGKITALQAKAAKAEPLNAQSRDITIRAPHFVFYVLSQLRNQYGAAMVEQGGITVKTTLDINKQDKAQTIVADQVAKLAGHNASNGGLISIEPSTGDIQAMVGSRGYDTPGFGAVNVTLANLQPGSSFKPIAYVTAFMKGWNGSTQVDDKPISEPNGDGTFYQPMNYDLKFRGQVTLRRALANSLNIPAVEVLKFAGIQTTLDMAHKLGITSLNDPSRYGLSLVLGGGEVRPIDMAAVYGTFANGGMKLEPRAILSVADRNGKDLTKNAQPKPVRALEAKYAAMITSILSDNPARTEEFGPNSPLKLSRPAAAKTGTTNDFRDNWTVGYTPGLVTAVWVGNNDHSAMNNVDGITGAAPIWHDYMEWALSGTTVQQFDVPADVTAFHVCSTGGLVDALTPGYTELAPINAPLTRQCMLMPSPSPSALPTASPTPDPKAPGDGGDITGSPVPLPAPIRPIRPFPRPSFPPTVN